MKVHRLVIARSRAVHPVHPVHPVSISACLDLQLHRYGLEGQSTRKVDNLDLGIDAPPCKRPFLGYFNQKAGFRKKTVATVEFIGYIPRSVSPVGKNGGKMLRTNADN